MATSRTKTLYAVDMIIAAAFFIGATSALAFLVPYSAIDFATASSAPTFLWLGYGFWRTLHESAGITMILGGIVHLALHWNWLVNTTRALLPGARHKAGLVSLEPMQAHELAKEASDA